MNYPIKVWLFTIILSPLLLFLRLWDFASDNGSDVTQGIALLALAVLYGAAFSFPALLLFNLLYRQLRYSALKKWLQKLALGCLGIVLIWSTFFFTDRKFIISAEFNNIIWPITYSSCLVIGVLMFNNIKERERLSNLWMRTTSSCCESRASVVHLTSKILINRNA